MRNVDAMLAAGIEAIPTFHFGSPWHYLEDIARKHRKIAIGGIAKLRGRKRREFVEQCFARTWPLRIHGFGVADRKLAFNYPFHSMDATNWRRPQKYGWYSDFGALRGSTCKSFRIEIRHYLQMQRDLRWRWREAMKEIEECPTT